MGGRQAVRPRPLEPVSKVRILPAQPVSIADKLVTGNRYDWYFNVGAVHEGRRRCFTDWAMRIAEAGLDQVCFQVR